MSKTVTRVSKPVKRVMRVIMIGLVAMLGAKAEAHYLIIKGKLRYCDVCCVVDLKGVPNPVVDGDVICEATPVPPLGGSGPQVELWCDGAPFSTVTLADPNSAPTMVGHQTINQSNWQQGKAQVVVTLGVPGTVFSDPNVVPVLPPGGVCLNGELPNVKFLRLRATICVGRDSDLTDQCSDAASSPASILEFASCTIEAGLNFPPDPPFGPSDYTCGVPSIVHIE